MRILVVDDHPLYLEAVERQIVRAFKRSDVGSFKNLADALASLAELPAELMMVDYSLPGLAGDGLAQVVAACGGAPLVVMSGVATAQDVAACIAAGAQGFLPKTMEGKVFTSALSIVLNGGTYLPAEFVGTTVTPALASGPEGTGVLCLGDFSPRENDLLRLVVAGATNKEIARKMGLQEVTVKFYLTRLFRRMGVRNRSQAAVVAVQMGVVSS
jgi:DNA-binding NarL/FixJ family response regulator